MWYFIFRQPHEGSKTHLESRTVNRRRREVFPAPTQINLVSTRSGGRVNTKRDRKMKFASYHRGRRSIPSKVWGLQVEASCNRRVRVDYVESCSKKGFRCIRCKKPPTQLPEQISDVRWPNMGSSGQGDGSTFIFFGSAGTHGRIKHNQTEPGRSSSTGPTDRVAFRSLLPRTH